VAAVGFGEVATNRKEGQARRHAGRPVRRLARRPIWVKALLREVKMARAKVFRVCRYGTCGKYCR
jgi:hypothetical protein